jgi:hypothetical protein
MLRKLVTVPLIEAVEHMAFSQLKSNYGGTYGEFRPPELGKDVLVFSMADDLPPISFATHELDCVMEATLTTTLSLN